MGRRAAGVHDALGNALVVEVRDLFAEVEIFEKGRSARARLERVLVIVDRQPLVRGEHGVCRVFTEPGEVGILSIGAFIGARRARFLHPLNLLFRDSRPNS